jgi:serine/tyrosine/threonine adenylyltransferase
MSLSTVEFTHHYAQLPTDFYRFVTPTPIPDPYLVGLNASMVEMLGISNETSVSQWQEYGSGNQLLPHSKPLATVYAGHQFGVYVPQLGDGRAILLGEVIAPNGQSWELQLKGAGPTPFSRGFDGRAVLRATIREYLAGEALQALGIPSTRSLAIVGSHLPVYRETVETAAVLLRLAATHIRFGTFEFFHHQGKFNLVKQLADYTIAHFFPEIFSNSNSSPYAKFFNSVVTRTAQLIAHWQAYGFAHGVLNTDNMSIIGITLDYGPYGFLDNYDPSFISNHSDHTGRYAFYQQPLIGLWNLQQLAVALSSLLSTEEIQAGLESYQPAFSDTYGQLLRARLGLQQSKTGDINLISDLLQLLQRDQVDYHYFFRLLSNFSLKSDLTEANYPQSAASIAGHRPNNGEVTAVNTNLTALFKNQADFHHWLRQYQQRLQAEGSIDDQRQALMRRVNPHYVLRNHLAQTVINAAQQQDFSPLQHFLTLLQAPFMEQPHNDFYAQPPTPQTVKIPISCSS